MTMTFPLLFLLSLSLLLLHHPPPISAASLLPKEALPTKSGYLPINSTSNSAMFYTFYEAQQVQPNSSNTPLLIWLQGGRGCSAMVGNFYELGPWRVVPQNNVEPRVALERNSGSWNRLFGVLFLDNPIGAGFSIAATPEEIPTDQNGVAEHLFAALTAFLGSDPSFKTRPIYFTGESYGAKYVSSIGYHILKKNAQLPTSQQINLAGVAIGNGMTDPGTQVAAHAVNAYFSGLINEEQRNQLEELENEAVVLTEKEHWIAATRARSRVLQSLQKMTGLATINDIRRQTPYETNLVTKFMRLPGVTKELLGGVVNESMVYEECSDAVKTALHEDVMKSVKYKVEYILESKVKVLLYQGQCDLRDGVVSTEAWVKKMEWEGIGKFMEAERKLWRSGNGELAGYVQKWGSLSHVVVLAAGHMVPTDQPVNSQGMIEDWVLERGTFAN